MEPALASCCYYGYVIALCAVGRLLARRYLPQSARPYEQEIVELIGTLQLCACVFENGAFLTYYGTLGYLFAGTLVAFVNGKTKEAVGNPAELVEATLTAGMPIVTFGRLLLAELAGGVAAFYVAQQFWRLRLSDLHLHRFEKFVCFTDLKVPPLHGLFYEGAASFVAQFATLYAAANAGRWRDAADLAVCALCTVVVIIGLNLTGMYFNPILATSLTFGCEGLDSMGHVEVYWVGPVLGQIAGTQLYKLVADKLPRLHVD